MGLGLELLQGSLRLAFFGTFLGGITPEFPPPHASLQSTSQHTAILWGVVPFGVGEIRVSPRGEISVSVGK